MAKYILSPQAQENLRKIHSYTLENYGKKQAVNYIKALRATMRDVANSPDARGMARDDIKKGYYSVFSGKHTIYYRILDMHIQIIDVLHQAQDPMRHL